VEAGKDTESERQGPMRRRWLPGTVIVVLLAAALGAVPAGAATPPSGTLTADDQGQGELKYTGATGAGTETGGQDQGAGCFGVDGKPSPTSGCDVFTLNVNVPPDFYQRFAGGPQITISNFNGAAGTDLDLYVYRRKPDGTADTSQLVTSAATSSAMERTTIPKGSGSYYLAVVPFIAAPGQTYDADVKFVTSPRLTVAQVNALAPAGLPNYRASFDGHNSHSEPTITMDPLNHDHLLAGSKQYDNLEHYLFKIGTYESVDGGRTWKDHDQLPGYCDGPGACDPSQPTKYHVTSDVSMAFDDEGDGYAFILDSPGGTSSSHGWNMNLHIKKPDKPWSQAIKVHDNGANPLTNALFLDDKNWLAIDNRHDVNGGVNRPRDGKIGPMYTCWGLDQAGDTGLPGVGQSIVFMRSLDGGHTWGGLAPGDNLPLPLSQKGVISGIGCHIAVGPQGEVYVTWYDNQLDALMQVKSSNFGRTFTPARPIATITGENSPFPGQAFRNLSIPTTGVDKNGNVYIAVMSQNGAGMPVVGAAAAAAQQLLQKGELDHQALAKIVGSARGALTIDQEAAGDAGPCPDQAGDIPCTDIILFKSTDGGNTYANPVRVNQDDPTSRADQFQPWMAITDNGQIDISYFDRRNDPNNTYIDTYLSRSNDGGKTFHDTRVSQSVWDPEINPPISPSGAFIGDYQGLVADDTVAIPFWNDTQYASRPTTDPSYSPYQEVSAARVPNG